MTDCLTLFCLARETLDDVPCVLQETNKKEYKSVKIIIFILIMIYNIHTMSKKTAFNKKSKNRNGQIVVEYVLLLLFSVVFAVIITKGVVSRDADEPGFLIKKWRSLIDFIAEDQPDEV